MISKNIILLAILLIHLCQISLAQNNFWVQTNGPTGGRITAVTISPSGKIYCGAQGGTVFHSFNEGKLWKQVFLGATRNKVISIITDTQGYVYFASDKDGIFRSGDDQTWEPINAGLTSLEITALDIMADGTLFAGTKMGLYRSLNAGKTWMIVEKLNEAINLIKVHKQNIFIVSNDNSLSYSLNGGKSWKQKQTPDNIQIHSLAIGPDNRIYAGTKKGDVFKCKNVNGVWEKIARFENNNISVLQVDAKGNIYTGLIYTGLLYAGFKGTAFQNEGGGVCLIPAKGGKPELILQDSSAAIWCIAIKNSDLYAGTNKGIYHSDDNGRNWNPVHSGLISQRVNDIVITKNDVVFAGSYGGVFRSDDSGNTWTQSELEEDIYVVDMAINKNDDLFACDLTSGIFRSSDFGNSWHKKNIGIPENNWLSSLAINSRNEIFVATSKVGVYRSLDNGDTWQPVNIGLMKTFYNALVIDSEDVVFAADTAGNVFRSDNNGDKWQKLQIRNPINNVPAELVVDSENRLYFGAVEKGVFRYYGKDNSWKQLNSGLKNTTIRSLVITKEGLIFAGTSGATNYDKFTGDDMFYSKDKGENWSLINSGLNHPRIKALAINSKGILFAGTWGGGVYKSLYPVTLIK